MIGEALEQRRRIAARVQGTVQGVGFRPFAFRLAHELGLGGFVLNDERGVELEVEGDPGQVAEFMRRLSSDAPALATIETVARSERPPIGERAFRIVSSQHRGAPDAFVSPDAATCPECLAELLDPADRRHRYPFINCTNCGPRFTIIRSVPYDRPATTMSGFAMCPACRREYEDPGDRRFHAQPNACPHCGPRAWLSDEHGRALASEGAADAVAAAAALLRQGAILAVKGIGGYHLACRAADEHAVASLRARKHREDKPFAVMAGDLRSAQALVALSAIEQRLLRGRERPIVIARRAAGAAVAAAVAPRSADLGVMLPYSPLHHLLLADVGEPLVLSSGNVSDEPIAFRDEDALQRLGPIVDGFLLHDRPIHVRTDDSVLRSLHSSPRAAPLMIRRSRGYVPQSLALTPSAPRPLLACGAELKATFCLARGARAWVGGHVGDLKNFETLRSFGEGIAHFERLFAVRPELVAHDLHPDYLSTRYALERDGVELLAVQHHHAHLAACLAEHGFRGRVVGAIYDGSGHGLDGSVWGGELLVGDIARCERSGHLLPVPLPGGDAAVREPWRMACVWLQSAFEQAHPAPTSRLRADVATGDWQAVARLAASGLHSPMTTSAGRLFDAVAALTGIRARVNYEGQAAAELEGLSSRSERGAYTTAICESGQQGPVVIDPRGALRELVGELERGVETALVSARFHNALAAGTARACALLAERSGVETVVLSGGVFQNRLLLERTCEQLQRAGLQVLVPERLPPNDGGVCFGQAAVAAAHG